MDAIKQGLQGRVQRGMKRKEGSNIGGTTGKTLTKAKERVGGEKKNLGEMRAMTLVGARTCILHCIHPLINTRVTLLLTFLLCLHSSLKTEAVDSPKIGTLLRDAGHHILKHSTFHGQYC
jgi:hypothetical protein